MNYFQRAHVNFNTLIKINTQINKTRVQILSPDTKTKPQPELEFVLVGATGFSRALKNA
ncbi:MAG: hypothetical protein R3Y06_08860 [Faecalibacterium sp.]